MRTAILGGSFNPPHIGHLQLAEEVRHMGYERILFIPSNISAHKPSVDRPTPSERLHMTSLAAARAGAEVDDCEIKRGGVSFSIETVSYCLDTYDVTGKPALIIGDDLINGFDRWKSAGELALAADILVARRLSETPLPFPYPHEYIENVLLPVSSSQIRELKAMGRAYKFLVPYDIFQYIEANNLYSQQDEHRKIL